MIIRTKFSDLDFQKLDVPLRGKKFAKTKLALLNAALDKIHSKPLDLITIKEICDDANVSEPTFFNYFKKKADLLVYYMDLWRIDVSHYADQCSQAKCGLEFIEAIFDRTAQGMQERPYIMREIINWKSALSEDPGFQNISAIERALAFPLIPETAFIDAVPVQDLFKRYLLIAKKKKELPPETSNETAIVALTALFYGVPLALGVKQYDRLSKVYQDELRLLWRGLSVR